MNDLCQSSLKNHLVYLDSLTAFHEKKRLYFYPKIFADAPVNGENWADFKVEYFRENSTINWLKLILPFVVYILILSVLAGFDFRRFKGVH